MQDIHKLKDFKFYQHKGIIHSLNEISSDLQKIVVITIV